MDLESLDGALPPRGRGNVERKDYLTRTKAISCGHCPYHRGENGRGYSRRGDRYKDHGREAVRGFYDELLQRD